VVVRHLPYALHYFYFHNYLSNKFYQVSTLLPVYSIYFSASVFPFSSPRKGKAQNDFGRFRCTEDCCFYITRSSIPTSHDFLSLIISHRPCSIILRRFGYSIVRFLICYSFNSLGKSTPAASFLGASSSLYIANFQPGRLTLSHHSRRP